ncbi:hypothetical protein [Christiangramia sabulilitoris]|uniref:DUF3221 domain-containing protein n=1 Tax=Christiangramia sabulilitoris TaxID=2583991 RepID=A0A550I963_9FLAO|nr:hypothetical protein [Christiangramia sabulilitoris]TRO67510.1 hypothetical protein FGM01_06395 [Christiangramia sabulilitoris]
MRKIVVIVIILTTGLGLGCKTEYMGNNIQYTGTIKAAGITSYQYGTHILESGDDFYALRSAEADLTNFEDQEVKLWAEKIAGYPVDGGPEYLEVKKVELVKLD